MQVLIVGAGALGSLLGARLSRTGAGVTLLARNREHLRAVRERGLTLEELDGSENVFRLPICGVPGEVPHPADLVLMVVKSPDTARAATDALQAAHRHTVFLTLQNGLGNVEGLSEVAGAERVVAGITTQGATLTAPGRVRHGGDGPTFVGEPGGPAGKRVWELVELFGRAGLEAHAEDHIRERIWEKLLVSAAINPITALGGVPNGWIDDCEAARQTARDALLEAAAVARAAGVTLRGDVERVAFEVARATRANRSSMLQDLSRRGVTEIDAINGAIVRLGDELGVEVPVNRTLFNLVKLIEVRNAGGLRHE